MWNNSLKKKKSKKKAPLTNTERKSRKTSTPSKTSSWLSSSGSRSRMLSKRRWSRRRRGTSRSRKTRRQLARVRRIRVWPGKKCWEAGYQGRRGCPRWVLKLVIFRRRNRGGGLRNLTGTSLLKVRNWITWDLNILLTGERNSSSINAEWT